MPPAAGRRSAHAACSPRRRPAGAPGVTAHCAHACSAPGAGSPATGVWRRGANPDVCSAPSDLAVLAARIKVHELRGKSKTELMSQARRHRVPPRAMWFGFPVLTPSCARARTAQGPED